MLVPKDGTGFDGFVKLVGIQQGLAFFHPTNTSTSANNKHFEIPYIICEKHFEIPSK